MSDLIHEVEESLKQERLEKIWKDYGSYIIAAIVAIVLGTGLVSGWKTHLQKQRMEQTQMIITAMSEDNQSGALIDIAGKLQPDQKALSLFTAAGILLQQDKTNEALASYTSIASDSSISPLYRDLAVIMEVKIHSAIRTATDNEKQDAQKWLDMLKPIWASTTNPWRFHARLQTAIIEARFLQNYGSARRNLTHIIEAGPAAPNSLIERTRALDHIFALNELEKKNADTTASGE